MSIRQFAGFLLLMLMVSAAAFAQETQTLSENLKPLQPYLGSWEGVFTNTEEGQQIKDVVSFEVILNGHAIRSVHTVTGGYSGETIYFFDEPTGTIRFWYYTNVGQWAEGVCEMNGDTMLTSATHHGGPVSGWTGETKMTGKDSFTTSSRYYQEGKWIEGHSADYKRTK